MSFTHSIVVPAKAKIQANWLCDWIPAFARDDDSLDTSGSGYDQSYPRNNSASDGVLSGHARLSVTATLYPLYRRPGEGQDPGELALRLDPGLRRDDDSLDTSGSGYDQSYPRNNSAGDGVLSGHAR